MNAKQFYGGKPKYKVRLPPEYSSECSELSDSDDDPDYTPPKQTIFYDSSSEDVALNVSNPESELTPLH